MKLFMYGIMIAVVVIGLSHNYWQLKVKIIFMMLGSDAEPVDTVSQLSWAFCVGSNLKEQGKKWEWGENVHGN